MFVGLIKDTGIVVQIELELIVEVNSDFAAKMEAGSHLAINGIIMRVLAKYKANRLAFH